MIVPEPPQVEHGWEIEKMPWLWLSIPRPPQAGHTFGEVPGFAPVPWQVGHGAEVGHGERHLRALDRLIEGQRRPRSRGRGRDLPRLRSCAPPRRRAATGPPPPNRFDRMSLKPPRFDASKPPGDAEAAEHAAAVIRLALVGIRQRVVRRGDLLEALLGLLVARVAIRVILAGELPVGLLDLLVGGVLADAEGLVVVGPLSHRRSPAQAATSTRAGRRTVSPIRYPAW